MKEQRQHLRSCTGYEVYNQATGDARKTATLLGFQKKQTLWKAADLSQPTLGAPIDPDVVVCGEAVILWSHKILKHGLVRMLSLGYERVTSSKTLPLLLPPDKGMDRILLLWSRTCNYVAPVCANTGRLLRVYRICLIWRADTSICVNRSSQGWLAPACSRPPAPMQSSDSGLRLM